MTIHERQAIREAVITRLAGPGPTYPTAAGARVFKTRLSPIRGLELPALNVYTDDEVSDAKNTAPVELARVVPVVVEGWVALTSGVDDALDALALQIETAMDSDSSFGDTVESTLTLTQFGYKLEGERQMGCVHLEYTTTYRTNARLGVSADEFDTADVQTSLGGTQATADQAHDLLTGLFTP